MTSSLEGVRRAHWNGTTSEENPDNGISVVLLEVTCNFQTWPPISLSLPPPLLDPQRNFVL